MAATKQDKNVRAGKALFEALTQQEIVDLIGAFLKVLPVDARAQVLHRLKPDTRQTVEQVLASPAKKAKGGKAKLVSTAKLAQTWAGLWQEWWDVVKEAAQEEGDYIEQEKEWEPPYFDDNAFVGDLEKVAKKMRPLIQTAFEAGFDPDMGFAAALLEAEDDVSGGMPEWMEITDGFYLEKDLTWCLLEWERLKAQAKGQDGFALARRILDWENEFAYVELEDDTFWDFFTQLPEADQEAVFKGLAANKNQAPWIKWLQNVHSRWHALYMYYAESRAPEQFMGDMRATIAQQWENGLRVIDKLLGEKNYEESLGAVQETLDALLKGRRREEAWTPESSLLFPIVSGWYSGEKYPNEKALLRYYQQAARGLKQTQLVKVLDIQRAAFNHFFNWEKMFKAFEEPSVPAPVRQALFASWRDRIVWQANPDGGGYGFDELEETWWLHWLIESIHDAEKGPSWFQKQVDQWLAQLPRELDVSMTTAPADFLRLLTKDLIEMGGKGKHPYPMFLEIVVDFDSLSSPDEKSRQKYLKAYAHGDLLDRAMAIWKEILHAMVPDPTSVHQADYSGHAEWMAALKEVAPQRYEALLKEWRAKHERRRNLWQAMAKMGLD